MTSDSIQDDKRGPSDEVDNKRIQEAINWPEKTAISRNQPILYYMNRIPFQIIFDLWYIQATYIAGTFTIAALRRGTILSFSQNNLYASNMFPDGVGGWV